MTIYNTDFIENPEQHNAINTLLSNITYDFSTWIAAKIDPLGLQPNLTNQIVFELESNPEYLETLSDTVLQDQEAKAQDQNKTNGVELAQKFRDGVLQVGGGTAQGFIEDIIKAASQVAKSAEAMEAIRGASNIALDIGHFGNALDITKGVAEYVKSGFSPTMALQQFMNVAVPSAFIAYAGTVGAALVTAEALPAIVVGSVVGILGFGVSQAVSAVSPHVAKAVEAVADFYAHQVDNAITGIVDIGKVIGSIADFYTDQIGNVYVGVAAIGSLIGSLSEALGHELSEPINALQDYLDSAAQHAQDAAHFIADVLDAFGAAEANASPLVLDLDSDGVELVSLANTHVRWDIDADGFAEATGWVAADDGLLAIDLNNDGVISTHEELFGNLNTDGFTDLRLLDSNHDNVINASDAQFADLLVWRDLNQNGVSEADELYTLAELNIVSINLNATTPYNMSIEGNAISHVSTYTVDDGVHGAHQLAIVDAWFNYDNTNTQYVGDYTLDLAALFVPTLRGYGELPALYISASIDNDKSNPDSLLSLLQAFAAKNLDGLFTDTDNHSVLNDVTEILYRWAGVDDVDPASRGQWVDARKLEFLEKLLGEPYLQMNTMSNPGSLAGLAVEKAFETALYPIAARLIAQGAGHDLFNDGTHYNPVTDTFEGFTEFKQSTLDELVDLSLDGHLVSDKAAFWLGIVNMIENSVGMPAVSSAAFTALENALHASDSTLTTQMLIDEIAQNIDEVYTGSTGENWTGTSSDDVHTGYIGDDKIHGGYGNDTLKGGIGNDTLDGSFGNDILNGQLGNDNLQGGGGADTYKFDLGQGNDTVLETGSDLDTLEFGAGITFADLSIVRTSNTELKITINPDVGSGSVTITGNVEYLKFADASVVDLRTMDQTLIGTSGNDSLSGVLAGTMGTGVDTIYGMDGNDTLYANAPNETDYKNNYLYGGNGNDTLFGSSGNDYLDGGAGNDTLKGGAGDDIYVFNYAGGDDTFTEYGGTDKILFGAGITQSMLNIYRLNNTDVKIDINDGLGGSITIKNQTYNNASYVIETQEFADHSSTGFSTLSMSLHGTSANDTLVGTNFGSSGVDFIYGHDGNDTITGYYMSSDTNTNYLYGGNGNDIINGASGIDYLQGDAGNDTLKGNSGNDVFVFNYGDGDDVFEDTSGTDKILFGEDITQSMLHIYRTSTYEVKIDIDNGLGGSIVLNNQNLSSAYAFETLEFHDGSTVQMSAVDLTLTGTSAAETLYGTNYGSSGVDTIYGMDGNDTIYGYKSVLDTKTNDLHGGNGNDTITGSNGVDYLYGDANDDTLKGGDGNDFLYGSDGVDYLEGNNGNDTLYGGAGADTLKGSAGVDTFVFQSMSDAGDTIQDYNYSAGEKLNIANILTLYHPLTDAITDFVQITQSGANSILSIDVDGGANSFVQLATLTATSGLTDEQALVNAGRLIVV